ncbi:MAG: carbohydrate-binding protein [Ruminococcaceae bacterium]|nr:carbohydrate-binding protein [Oscillospiraceae bacterium]
MKLSKVGFSLSCQSFSAICQKDVIVLKLEIYCVILITYISERGIIMKKRIIAALLVLAMIFSAVPAMAVSIGTTGSFAVEAESYSAKNGNHKIMNDGAASGGKYIGDYNNLCALKYDVTVEAAGNYKVILRVATQQNSCSVVISNNGNISQSVSVPNTGGWQRYRDIEATLWLDEGEQVIQATAYGNYFNLDKMTFEYIDSEKEIPVLEEHLGIQLQNRWKSQRLVERGGVLAYADSGDSDYGVAAAKWDLIPDGEGYYMIKNVESGKYVTMTEGTDVVSLSETAGNAAKWQYGSVSGYMLFYNKMYYGHCINLEHQSSNPDQILATTDTYTKYYSAQWEIYVPATAHTYTISGDKIEGTAGTATANADGTSITVNENGSLSTWTLSRDISGAPVFTADNMPMMEAVYNLTMEEVYKNIHGGTYGDVFWTGTNWSKVWTRDTAMSVHYSLAWIFPEETENSIREKIIGGKDSPLVWEEDTGTGGSYPSSIDRVIMMIASWELYQSTGDVEFLEYVYGVTANTIEQDYHVAYDDISGLFKGETGGLDHRSKTYPDWMDENEQDSISNIAESKAGNANIIYAQVLNIMAQAAEVLGKDNAVIADWEAKYEDLKDAINERLWLEDREMYSSWEYPEYMGSPAADKVDVIANGYAALFGIADEEQTQAILENYPLVVYGADTVWPQKTGRQFSAIYHNRGVWPGWEAALMMAAKENGNNQVADEIFKSCVRGAGMSLTNKEVINFETGEGIHSDQQLWSVAGTLAGYYRVLFGMTYGDEGISFAPFVPEWMEGPYSLSNFTYRNAVLNLKVEGTGDTLVSITVNGEAQPLDYVLPTDAEGTYDIVMVVEDSGERSKFHLEEDSWAICPPLPVLRENADGTLTWTENSEYTYKLWTGKEFVPVSGGSYTPDRTVYGAYSLVAVDKYGITSEMSKPVIISPDNSVLFYEAEDAEYNSRNFENTAQGFTGTGYVNDFLAKRTDITFTVDVPVDGQYQLSTIYNNYSDPTSGQDGGIRSVYVDGVDIGTMVFPCVKYDFQLSTHLYVFLTAGEHTISFKYNEDDWYDTNMTTARGSAKNSVSYDSLTLQLLYTPDMGDVNLDGMITNADVIALARYLVHIVEFSDAQVYYADVTGDGVIKNSDLIKLARSIVKA